MRMQQTMQITRDYKLQECRCVSYRTSSHEGSLSQISKGVYSGKVLVHVIGVTSERQGHSASRFCFRALT